MSFFCTRINETKLQHGRVVSDTDRGREREREASQAANLIKLLPQQGGLLAVKLDNTDRARDENQTRPEVVNLC